MLPKIKGITKIEYFTHGKRGDIYTGNFKGKKVIIKIKRPESKALGRIENEGKWLEILNNYGIGPQLVMKGKDYVVYYYAEGEFIEDYFLKASKQEILSVIKNIFEQVRALDKLKIDKEEMHNPVKHILIGEKITLIDFERCHHVDEPKNVTQFVQFIISGLMAKTLCKKGIDINPASIINCSRAYKHEQTDERFEQILNLFLA